MQLMYFNMFQHSINIRIKIVHILFFFSPAKSLKSDVWSTLTAQLGFDTSRAQWSRVTWACHAGWCSSGRKGCDPRAALHLVKTCGYSS